MLYFSSPEWLQNGSVLLDIPHQVNTSHINEYSSSSSNLINSSALIIIIRYLILKNQAKEYLCMYYTGTTTWEYWVATNSAPIILRTNRPAAFIIFLSLAHLLFEILDKQCLLLIIFFYFPFFKMFIFFSSEET